MCLKKRNEKFKKEFVSENIEKQILYFKTDYDEKKRNHYKMRKQLTRNIARQATVADTMGDMKGRINMKLASGIVDLCDTAKKRSAVNY
jgi:hypothetical protein